MTPRALRAHEAPALATLTVVSIRELGRGIYSPLQLAAWLAWAEDAEAFAASLARGPVLVVERAGAIAGYAQYDPIDRLALLYVHPDHARRGVARALVEAVAARARSVGVRRLRTEASRVARPAFERLGFELVAREVVARGGERIERFRMARDLG